MNRTIALNEIEPAPLSLRWSQGLDLPLDLTVMAQNGTMVDLSLISPALILEPRSGGPVQSYAGVTDQAGLGTATFRIPGSDYKDSNGYRISLFGAIDGVMQLIARGVGVVTQGPAIPAGVGTGVPLPQRGTFNLNIIRNDSWTWQFTLWGNSAKTIPSDLTDATVTAQIRAILNGPIIVNLGIEMRDPANGVVWMSITSGQSGILPSTPSYWDMQIAYPDGSIRTPVGGRVFVTEDVTR